MLVLRVAEVQNDIPKRRGRYVGVAHAAARDIKANAGCE